MCWGGAVKDIPDPSFPSLSLFPFCSDVTHGSKWSPLQDGLKPLKPRVRINPSFFTLPFCHSFSLSKERSYEYISISPGLELILEGKL